MNQSRLAFFFFLLLLKSQVFAAESTIEIDSLNQALNRLMGGPTVDYCPDCSEQVPLARTQDLLNINARGQMSKQRCSDSGGVFAIDYGCQNMSVPSPNLCTAQITGRIDNLQVVLGSETLKNTGDHRSTTFRKRMGHPYYRGAQNARGESEQNYLVKFDRDTSAEIQLVRQANGQYRLSKYNIYTKHVESGSGNNRRRTFHQYSCTQLR